MSTKKKAELWSAQNAIRFVGSKKKVMKSDTLD